MKTDRFTVIITSENNKTTLEIIDYLTGTKTEVPYGATNKTLSIGWMIESIIKILKPKYREIINK